MASPYYLAPVLQQCLRSHCWGGVTVAYVVFCMSSLCLLLLCRHRLHSVRVSSCASNAASRCCRDNITVDITARDSCHVLEPRQLFPLDSSLLVLSAPYSWLVISVRILLSAQRGYLSAVFCPSAILLSTAFCLLPSCYLLLSLLLVV